MADNYLIAPDPKDWLSRSNRLQDLEDCFSASYLLLEKYCINDINLKAWIINSIICECLTIDSSISADFSSELMNIIEDDQIILFDREDVLMNLTNELKTQIISWCHYQWSAKVDSLFLMYKDQLDRVTCRFARIPGKDLSIELYHRLKNKEQSFEEILSYPIGKERFRGGLFECQRLQALPRQIIPLIRSMSDGQLLKPYRVDKDTYILLKLEKFYPSSLNFENKLKIYELQLVNWIKLVLPILHSTMTRWSAGQELAQH